MQIRKIDDSDLTRWLLEVRYFQFREANLMGQRYVSVINNLCSPNMAHIIVCVPYWMHIG